MVRAIIVVSALVAMVASVAAAPHSSLIGVEDNNIANDFLTLEDIYINDILNDNYVDILKKRSEPQPVKITRQVGVKPSHSMGKDGAAVDNEA